MSEGDAQPVVYLEVQNGRTGQTFLYQISEGSPEWVQMKGILNQIAPVAQADAHTNLRVPKHTPISSPVSPADAGPVTSSAAG